MKPKKIASDRPVQLSKSVKMFSFEEFTAFLIENGPLDPDQLHLISCLADLEAINRS
ncbi:MAG: hypothetical protein PUE16_09635 [Lactimicrobium massiliense]|nr:hypothetical protein [Lactimicrobium massiliense]MDD6727578.1 hypothetical protein [Lactimicrobium massiliense]